MEEAPLREERDSRRTFLKQRLLNISDEILASIITAIFTTIFGGLVVALWKTILQNIIWIVVLLVTIVFLVLVLKYIWRNREEKWFIISAIAFILLFLPLGIATIVGGIELLLLILTKYLWWLLGVIFAIFMFKILIKFLLQFKDKKWLRNTLNVILVMTIILFGVTLFVKFKKLNISSPFVGLPAPIHNLSGIKETATILNTLNSLSKEGKITCGEKADFELTASSHLYVILLDEKIVSGIFRFINEKYVNIKTKREIPTLTPQYAGKRQIWIHYTDENKKASHGNQVSKR